MDAFLNSRALKRLTNRRRGMPGLDDDVTRVLKFMRLLRGDISWISIFFQQRALRARDLAEKADPFTRKRLLAPAERYDAKREYHTRPRKRSTGRCRLLASRRCQLARRQGAAEQAWLTFLQGGVDFLDRPAFASSDHVHLGAAIHQHVGADVIVGRYEGQIGLGIPVQRHIEVAWKDLPARTAGLRMWLSEWDLIFMA